MSFYIVAAALLVFLFSSSNLSFAAPFGTSAISHLRNERGVVSQYEPEIFSVTPYTPSDVPNSCHYDILLFTWLSVITVILSVLLFLTCVILRYCGYKTVWKLIRWQFSQEFRDLRLAPVQRPRTHTDHVITMQTNPTACGSQTQTEFVEFDCE